MKLRSVAAIAEWNTRF